MITANSPLSLATCNEATQILRQRYISHEIDATLYASLMEDIKSIEMRLHRERKEHAYH